MYFLNQDYFLQDLLKIVKTKNKQTNKQAKQQKKTQIKV